jgi:metal-responsive CopG/Arc/MetJ family transcriptional regulator
MEYKKLAISLPVSLLTRIDEKRAREGFTRSGLIAHLLRAYLDATPQATPPRTAHSAQCPNEPEGREEH